tara:strand:- start:418 stop:1746 length:1329 start_codon:yes stop_codon:yes gene_type:complete
MPGHFDVLGLSPGICTQHQVELAFMQKAKQYVDKDWSTLGLGEKRHLAELLGAFEVLGSGTTVQLKYLQFMSNSTIHGFAPVDANNIYKSTFDTDNTAHTTLMQIPCTDDNINDMLRLSLVFNAYRMLGHRLKRSASEDVILHHYQQFSADMDRLTKDKGAREHAQHLEHMPANANIAFYQARLNNANQAYQLLSTHRDTYDTILSDGYIVAHFRHFQPSWADKIHIIPTETSLRHFLMNHASPEFEHTTLKLHVCEPKLTVTFTTKVTDTKEAKKKTKKANKKKKTKKAPAPAPAPASAPAPAPAPAPASAPAPAPPASAPAPAQSTSKKSGQVARKKRKKKSVKTSGKKVDTVVCVEDKSGAELSNLASAPASPRKRPVKKKTYIEVSDAEWAGRFSGKKPSPAQAKLQQKLAKRKKSASSEKGNSSSSLQCMLDMLDTH